MGEINRVEEAIRTSHSELLQLKQRIPLWQWDHDVKTQEAKTHCINARKSCEQNLTLYRSLLANQSMWSAAFDIPHRLCLGDKSSLPTNQTYTEFVGIKIKVSKIKDDHFYIYRGMLFEVSGPYNGEEGNLLVRNYFAKKRAKIESLQNEGEPQLNRQRTVIPESVRHEVWRRDQGCCVECGSKERLEYDHLIPFSKGGSNTARNLRLLCETCNRRKSASI